MIDLSKQRRRRAIVTAARAVKVDPPVGWTWTLPFSIWRTGRRFAPDASFNLRTRANITVTKEYFLDTANGAAGNTGTDRAHPLDTWNNIIGKGDYDRITILNGSILTRATSSLALSRSCEVIGEGTVLFTSDRAGNLAGAWALSAGQTYTYQHAVSGGELIATVYDEGTLDAYGHPTRYASKASIAQVEATPGSFYWAAGATLYVHTLDDSDPTGNTNLKYYDSSAIYWGKDNLTWYFQNIQFRGGVTFRNATAAGTATKAYLQQCTGHKLVVAGISEFIARRCTFYTSNDDTANYDILNGVVTNAIAIDCNFGDGGIDTTNQASTGHNGSQMVDINCDYGPHTGQITAEAGATSQRWSLGTRFHDSGSGIGVNSAGKAWLDRCSSSGNATYDLQVAAGGHIYIRSFVGGGQYSGTPEAY